MRIRTEMLIFITAVVVLNAWQSLSAEPVLSHAPGNYKDNILLEVIASDDSDALQFRFLENTEDYLLDYSKPLQLSALKGEERQYNIEVLEFRNDVVLSRQTYTYTIDKRPPEPPSLTLASGIYFSHQSALFEPSGSENIFFAINDSLENSAEKWNGFALSFLQDEYARSDYTLTAYSEDEAGNRSSVALWTFSVMPPATKTSEPFLSLISPVNGSFGNKQLLYVQSYGFDLVTYTTDNSEPNENSPVYSGPVFLDETGNISLKVYGRSSSGEVVRRSVQFFVESNEALAGIPQSGLYPDGLSLNLQNQDTYNFIYTLQERSPASFDRTLERSVEINASSNMLRVVPLRISRVDKKVADYRFLYILDSRKPITPLVHVYGKEPFNDAFTVAVTAPPESSIYYTVDGSDPTNMSIEYNGIFTVRPPSDGSEGEITIRCISILPNGKKSPVIEKVVRYDTKAPEPPLVNLMQDSAASPVRLRVAAATGERIRYKYSWKNQNNIDSSFDITSGNTHEDIFTVPFGMDADFEYQFYSIDSAGNVSEEAATGNFRIDNLPPERPSILVSENEVSIVGEGNIYYSLFDQYSNKRLVGFQKYTGPFTVPMPENDKSQIVISSYVEDETGNRTALFHSDRIVLDTRAPFLPHFYGVSDGSHYNSSSRELIFKKGDPDLRFAYSVTYDGSEPDGPDRNGLVTESSIIFAAQEGSETLVRAKIKPFFLYSVEEAPVTSLSFTLDTVVPELPQLIGLPDENSTNGDFILSLLPEREDETVHLLVTEEMLDSNRFPLSNDTVYSEPMKIFIRQNEEYSYFIYRATEDLAGNLVYAEEPDIIIVDTKAPKVPDVFGIPDNGITTDDTTIYLETDEGEIFYEFTFDGTLPKLPDAESPIYDGPILIQSKADEEIPVSIVAAARDDMGNFSAVSPIVRFTIDRKKPDDQFIPLILKGSATRATVSWQLNNGVTIFYAISSDEDSSKLSFQQYVNPFNFSSGGYGADDLVYLHYFAIDRAGNEGDKFVEKISFQKSIDLPFISGIVPEGLYNSAVKIVNNTANGTVRYEISSLGNFIQPVTEYSSPLNEYFEVDIAAGETSSFIFSARTFSEDGNSSETITIPFTIDKTPPAPPTIDGIVHEKYYKDQQTFALSSEEGSVFYSVRKENAVLNIDETDSVIQFREYLEPVSRDVEDGDFGAFIVEAFTEDAAGNRSDEIKKWRYYIDRGVVYVSKEGADRNSGVRDLPVNTLQRAIQIVESTNRNTIFLQEGVYELHEPILLDSDLTIIGGFNSVTWSKTDKSNLTSIIPSEAFEATEYLFNPNGKTLGLNNITTNNGQKNVKTIFQIDTGEITFANAAIVSSVDVAALQIYGGTVSVDNSSFRNDSLMNVPLINVNNGTFVAANSSIMARGLRNNTVLIAAKQNGEVILSSCEMESSGGQRATLIHVTGSSLRLYDSRLLGAKGVTHENLLHLENSRLVSERNTFKSSGSAGYSTLVAFYNSFGFVVESSFICNAKVGTTGLLSNSSRVNLSKNNFAEGSAGDFTYGLQFVDSESVLENNVFGSLFSADSITIKATESKLDLRENRVAAGKGSNITFALRLSEKNVVNLESNVFEDSHTDTISTIAYIEKQDNTMSLKDNIYSNWSHILGIQKVKQVWDRTEGYVENIDKPSELFALAETAEWLEIHDIPEEVLNGE